MTPEDIELWKLVTNSIVPKLLKPFGLVQRQETPPAPRISPISLYVPATLDLHGYTIADAYRETRYFINAAAQAGRKSVVIITGKSGPIRREFPFWIDGMSVVRGCDVKSGGGAFALRLAPRK